MTVNKENLPTEDNGLGNYILNAINAGVLFVNKDFNIRYANQPVLDKLKVAKSSILNKSFLGMPGVGDKEKLRKILLDVRSNLKPTKIPNIQPVTGGESEGLVVDLLIHPWLDRAGNFTGWVVICEEINISPSFFNDALRVNIFIRYVVNLMSEGATVTNREARLEYANKRFYEMLGYEPEDVLNKKWTDWCYEEDLIEVEDGKKIKGEVVQNGVSVFRLRLKKKDGSLLPVTMSVLKNVEEELNIGSIGVIVDDTEKIKLESEYNEVSNLNKKILETIHTYIVTLDDDMKIKFINRRVAEEFNIDANEIVGKKISDILPSLRVIEDWSSWVLRSLRPYKVDRYKLNTEGEKFMFINVDIQPFYLANQPNGVVCSFDDVTLSARLEEQIEASYRELEITHGKLANFLKRQSDFLADVSHELRTPLTIIKGNIEVVLQNQQVPLDELKEVLVMVENEVSRMSVMVGDLLMLTKMDQSGSTLKIEEFNTDQLIDDLQSKIIMYKEYENRFKIGQVDQVMLKADRDKILALVWNLVENGLKYSSENDLVEINILRSTTKDELIIEVIDEGMGISEQDLKNVFDRFFRVDKARSRDRGGSGLGLAICKRIVATHLGRIEVESKIDSGTKFMVFLPIIVSKN